MEYVMSITPAHPFLYETKQDPRFSDNGNTFQKSTLKERFRSFLTQVKLGWKSVFTTSSEKRRIYKQLFICKSLEKKLSKAVEETYVDFKSHSKNRGDYLHFALEDQFLEETSKLYKMVHPTETTNRLFPREILSPYYDAVRPQRKYQTPDKLTKKGDTNNDFDSLAWASGLPQLHKSCKSKDPEHYLEHFEFVRQVVAPGDKLMESVRAWRAFLSKDLDKEIADFDALKSNLSKCIDSVKTTWDNYKEANPDLKISAELFSEKSFHAKLWQNQLKHKKNDAELINEGHREFKEALFRKYPDSRAAKVYRKVFREAS